MFRLGAIYSVLLATCIFLHTKCAEVDQSRLLRFLSVASGYSIINIDNNGTIIPESMEIIPVYAAAFYPSITYFYEEVINNNLFLRHIFVLYQGNDGLIRATPYNFTGWRDDEIGKMNLTVFETKPRSDYYTLPNCEMVITEVDTDDTYMANLPECEAIINDLIPTFAVTWKCNSTGFINYKNPEYKPQDNVPVVMKKSFRYPLQPYMLKCVENFVDPCD